MSPRASLFNWSQAKKMEAQVRIVLEAEDRLRLEMAVEEFDVVSEGGPLSPYHLLAASLANCTAMTIASWVELSGIDITPLVITVTWQKVEELPKRIAHMEMTLRLPGLPSERRDALARAADQCPIHATLVNGIQIDRQVVPS